MPTRIRGVVLSTDGRTPQSGVHVEAYDPGTSFAQGDATTDTNGNFTLSGLEDRTWIARLLVASASRFVELVKENWVEDEPHAQRTTLSAHGFAEIRGTLGADKGGTGIGSPATGVLLVGAGAAASAMTALAPGAAGGFVRSDGSSWVRSTVASGDLPAHNILSTTHGDTLADAVLRGDLISGNATPAWSRLALGVSAGMVLQVNAGATDPVWNTVSGDITITGAGVTAIGANKVTNLILRQSIGLSVMGRGASGTGTVQDLQATAASDAVLRESSSTLGFGTIATGGIANDAITYAKLQNVGATSVVARAPNSSGDAADLAALSDGQFLVRRSSALTFGGIVAGDVPDLSATYQPLDADLTAIAALSSTGILVRTASNTWAQRTVTASDSRITVTNPGGVAGNIDLTILGAALTKVDDTNVTLTLGGTPTTALLVAASLTLGWAGQLSLARGGTAANLTAVNGGIVYSGAAAFAISAAGSSGQILRSAGAGAPTWSTATYPSAISGIGSVIISDGTNFVNSAFLMPNAYTTGDLIQATGANVLGRLTAVATGNALISGGSATISSWGKIGLTTHVSGILPTPNGGTGVASPTSGNLLIGAGASAMTLLAPGAAGGFARSDGSAWVRNTIQATDVPTAVTDLIYGDGSDGDVTIAADTTLTAGPNGSDKFYNTLTINSGAILYTNGHRVFVKGTLAFADTTSKIQSGNKTDASTGGNASGVTGGIAGGFLTLGTTGAGGTGTAGKTATNGAGGTATAAQSTYGDGGSGGDGGAGGAGVGGGGTAGGATGTGTATIRSKFREFPLFIVRQTYSKSCGGTGGRGGSAGGGAGTTNVGGGGGGGGSGGYPVEVYAKAVTGAGVITSPGKAGGNGANGVGNGRGGGGGGGGGGGPVLLVTNTTSPAVSLISVGGAGGTAGTGGSTGGIGSAGATLIINPVAGTINPIEGTLTGNEVGTPKLLADGAVIGDPAGRFVNLDTTTDIFEVRSTVIPQVRFSYDAVNYTDLFVDSSGTFSIYPGGVTSQVNIVGNLALSGPGGLGFLSVDQGILSGGPISVNPGVDAVVLAVAANSGAQTAHIQDWYNSAGVVKAFIRADAGIDAGSLKITNVLTPAASTDAATKGYVDGLTAGGANPTASVGLSAVNGTALTFLRSDGAPALSQSIAPTWSATHTFSVEAIFNGGLDIGTSGRFDSNVADVSNAAGFFFKPSIAYPTSNANVLLVHDSIGNPVLAMTETATNGGSCGVYAATSNAANQPVFKVGQLATNTNYAALQFAASGQWGGQGNTLSGIANAVTGISVSTQSSSHASNAAVIGASIDLEGTAVTRALTDWWGVVVKSNQGAGVASAGTITSAGGIKIIGNLTGQNRMPVTNWYSVYAGNSSSGANPVTTNAYGFYAEEQTRGGTIKNGFLAVSATAGYKCYAIGDQNSWLAWESSSSFSLNTTTVLCKADLKVSNVGNGVYIKEGTNATMGVATLVLGTVVVNTTKVTANSRIFLTVQALGTVAVATPIAVTARTAGTSFTITSSSATDTSVIAWMIVEPA